jgi:ribosomal protein L30E
MIWKLTVSQHHIPSSIVGNHEGYSKLSNLSTLSVLDEGYSKLSNLSTLSVLDEGYSRIKA